MSRLIFPGVILLLCGCVKEEVPEPSQAEYENVFLVYSSGYNNLSDNLKQNIEDLCSGDVPFLSERNALLVFSHKTVRYGDYGTPNAPALYRVARRNDGKVVRDTLVRYPSTYVSASAECLGGVLNFVKKNFPAKHVGMLFSSHGSGWVPKDAPAETHEIFFSALSSQRIRPGFAFMYGDNPLTKTIGVQDGMNGSRHIELEDFAAAIPFKLDYLILDACLMGGIETAWALKDKCDRLAISPSEILGKGYYVYADMPRFLLNSPEADLKGLCEDFYNFYMNIYYNHSVTVTLLDCSKVGKLLDPVKAMVDARLENMRKLDVEEVQSFIDSNSGFNRCFCDLMDLAEKAGASEGELLQIRSALEECIIYSAHSNYFNGNKIEKYCGLTMYCPGYEGLDMAYEGLSWNKACGLVR